MGKWSSRVQGKALRDLLANGVTTPSFTKSRGIGPAKGVKPEFAEVKEKRFRENFKNAAKDYVLSAGAEAQPTKADYFPKLAKPAGESRFQEFCAVLI